MDSAHLRVRREQCVKTCGYCNGTPLAPWVAVLRLRPVPLRTDPTMTFGRLRGGAPVSRGYQRSVMPRRSTIQRLSAAAIAAAGAIVASVLDRTAGVRRRRRRTRSRRCRAPAASTPLADQTVTVEGVVTADHRSRRLPRLSTSQTAGPDTDYPGRSDGIFVFLNTAADAGIGIGDKVRVTGRRASSAPSRRSTPPAPGAVELVAGRRAASSRGRPRCRNTCSARARGLRGHAGPPDRHLQARVEPQPAELRRALDERRLRHAGRGLRDRCAEHQDRERHHDGEQQRAPDPRRRLQHPRSTTPTTPATSPTSRRTWSSATATS